MTTICAKVSDDGTTVTLGSDRLTYDGLTRTMRQPKWVNIGEGLWFATAGTARPDAFFRSKAGDIDVAIQKGEASLCKLLQEIMCESGSEGEREDGDTLFSIQGFILKVGVAIWGFGGDLYPEKLAHGDFNCYGSGRTVAFGSAFTSSQLGESDGDLVKNALKAAASLDQGSGAPLDLFVVNANGVEHHDAS